MTYDPNQPRDKEGKWAAIGRAIEHHYDAKREAVRVVGEVAGVASIGLIGLQAVGGVQALVGAGSALGIMGAAKTAPSHVSVKPVPTKAPANPKFSTHPSSFDFKASVEKVKQLKREFPNNAKYVYSRAMGDYDAAGSYVGKIHAQRLRDAAARKK